MDRAAASGLVILPGSFARFGWDIFLFFALMFTCVTPQLRLFRQYRTRIEPIGEDHDDDHAEPAPSA
jgi:hypothetical protein